MSDVLKRLQNQPPFTDDKGNVVEEKPNEQTNQTVQEDNEQTGNERTREQFQKLTQSNQNLNQENEQIKEENETLKKENEQQKKELEAKKEEARRLASEGMAGLVTPPTQTPPQNQYWDQMVVNTPPQNIPGMTNRQVNEVFKGLVDDEGYVNTDLLKDELAKAQAQTQQAIREAQIARQEAQQSKRSFDDFQRNSVAKSVHEKHPNLNPESDQFDPEYYDFVKNEMVGQLVRGEREDFMKAADKWADRFKKDTMPDTKQQEQIAQINATSPKGQSRGFDAQETDQLRKDMWKNKKGAIAARLARSGY